MREIRRLKGKESLKDFRKFIAISKGKGGTNSIEIANQELGNCLSK
jgi:hypothetical protein